MDNHKIAFIVCINDEACYNEWLWFLNRLSLPDGFEAEVYPVQGAESMPQGYNYAMHASDAKYKIYMHQDVFLFDQEYIVKLISYFEDHADVGMVGMLGSNQICEDASFWNHWNLGATQCCNYASTTSVEFGLDKACDDVKAIDGMFMATQYDLAWREDLNLGWDYYDVSQSFEFLRAGYKIAIINETPVAYHDCGVSNLQNYESGRKAVIDAYSDFLTKPYYENVRNTVNEVTDKLYSMERTLLDAKQYEELLKLDREFHGEIACASSNLYRLHALLWIYEAETKENSDYSFIGKYSDFEESVFAYNEAKYLLLNAQFCEENDAYLALKTYLQKNRLSNACLEKMMIQNFVNASKVHGKLTRILNEIS